MNLDGASRNLTVAALLTLSGGTTGTRFCWRGDRVLP